MVSWSALKEEGNLEADILTVVKDRKRRGEAENNLCWKDGPNQPLIYSRP